MLSNTSTANMLGGLPPVWSSPLKLIQPVSRTP
jgi:hypothetical protein